MESRHASEAVRVIVAILDDAIREKLASQLAAIDGVAVIGRYADGARVLAEAERADLVFIDRTTLQRLSLVPGDDGERTVERHAWSLLGSVGTDRFLQRIPVRTRDGFRIIPVEELVSAVARKEYLHLTTGDGERHVILYALKELHARLDPMRFIRVSRGALVNLAFVRQIVPGPGGQMTVALRNGEQFDASRRRARELRQRLLRL